MLQQLAPHVSLGDLDLRQTGLALFLLTHWLVFGPPPLPYCLHCDFTAGWGEGGREEGLLCPLHVLPIILSTACLFGSLGQQLPACLQSALLSPQGHPGGVGAAPATLHRVGRAVDCTRIARE